HRKMRSKKRFRACGIPIASESRSNNLFSSTFQSENRLRNVLKRPHRYESVRTLRLSSNQASFSGSLVGRNNAAVNGHSNLVLKNQNLAVVLDLHAVRQNMRAAAADVDGLVGRDLPALEIYVRRMHHRTQTIIRGNSKVLIKLQTPIGIVVNTRRRLDLGRALFTNRQFGGNAFQ